MPLKLADEVLTKNTEDIVSQLETLRNSAVISIYATLNDKIVDYVARQIELKKRSHTLKKNLDIILNTAGGDPDVAFNIGRLLQRSASNITLIVPRKAKSAGTLLACAADQIIMLAASELGPIDTQITQLDEDGNPVNSFSALAVRAAEEKIKFELSQGNEKYAEILAKRMPDAITSTELERALNISHKYIRELIMNRMFKKSKLTLQEKEAICKKLIEGYSHHGYVIDIKEAKQVLKLNVVAPTKQEEELFQKIHWLHLKREQLFSLMRNQRRL
jgi:membrane-bound ClpP family serine protease